MLAVMSPLMTRDSFLGLVPDGFSEASRVPLLILNSILPPVVAAAPRGV